MQLTRRDLGRNLAIGLSSLWLRSLTTGLPISWLLQPIQAAKAQSQSINQQVRKPTFLIYSTSEGACPINNNAPHSYDYPNFKHSSSSLMNPTTWLIGNQQHTAGYIWTTLDPEIVGQLALIHHQTHIELHSLKGGQTLNSQIKAGETLPGLIANQMHGALQTTNTTMLSTGSNINFQNNALVPQLTPIGLKSALARVPGQLGKTQTLRDATVDKINTILKPNVTASEKRLLDSFILSRQESRQLSDAIINTLDQIQSDDTAGEIAMLCAVFLMRLTPAVGISLGFGGDNHWDDEKLSTEVNSHQQSIDTINLLYKQLKAYNLHTQVTFALLNAFGRTFEDAVGRTHHGGDNLAMVFGPAIQAGVYGSLSSDGKAVAFDGNSGQSSPSGTINADNGFASVGRTIGAACGIAEKDLDEHIPASKTITAMLR